MHVVYVIAPGGGPEAYVRTLIPELERRGHRVSLVMTIPPAQYTRPFPPSVLVRFAPPGARHYYAAKVVGRLHAWPLRLRAWETAWAVRKALDDLEQERPINLVEVTEGLPLKDIARRWPVLVRAHGAASTFRHFCGDGAAEADRWLAPLEGETLRTARAVSPLSQHLADHLRETYRVPAERLHVLPYPIDTDLFCPAPERRGAPSLLTIGRIEKRKGTDTLVQAAVRQIWPRFPDCSLVFLGSEGDLTQEDLCGIVPEAQRDHLVFPGFAAHDTLPGHYQKATLYAAPSRYETFAYTVLEAMACGRAVVSTRSGAIPELVEEGRTGLLVERDDPDALGAAIVMLLGDAAQRERMGCEGRRKAERCALAPVVERTVELYESVSRAD